MLAIGPSSSTSRVPPPDIYIAAITLRRSSSCSASSTAAQHDPALIGVLLALSFATGDDVDHRVRRRTFSSSSSRAAPGSMLAPIRAWDATRGLGLAAFVGIFTVLLTTFLTCSAASNGIYTPG